MPLNLYRDLDLEALFSIVANSQTEQVAFDAVFGETFSNFTIKVVKNSTKFSLSSELENVVEEHDLNLVLNVLKTVGHLIRTLKIDYGTLDVKPRSLINQQLSKVCAKSLLEIEITHCNDNDFLDFLGPFEKVEKVKLRFGNLKEDSVRFDQIFPSVRRLDVGGMQYVHSGFIKHQFAHLKHLIVEFWDNENLSSIQKCLQLNPQLQSVSLYQCDWNILKMMSETMSNLENLELNGFNDFSTYIGDDIRFENLKVFRFKKFSALPKTISKIPLIFGNLEEMSCLKPMHLWFEIIIQNKKLKKLRTGEISQQQLFRIAEELPDLEDFATGYNTYDSINKVVRFIKQGKHLKKVAFWQSNFNSRTEIVAQLGNEWKIVEEGGRFAFIKN